MMLFFDFLSFLIGVSLASFANMWSYRHPPDKKMPVSLLKAKRSYCDYCYRPLSWWENIPLFSFIILRGRSRCCHRQLPLIYPISEFLGGLNAFLAWRGLVVKGLLVGGELFYLRLFLVAGLFFFSLFIVSHDLRYYLLPSSPLLALLVVSLVYWLFFSRSLTALLAGMVNVFFMFLLYLLTKGKGLGLGDIILVFFFPLVSGVVGGVMALWLAFVLGAGVGLILVLIKRDIHLKSMIPLAPFLIIAFWLSFAFQWWQLLLQ